MRQAGNAAKSGGGGMNPVAKARSGDSRLLAPAAVVWSASVGLLWRLLGALAIGVLVSAAVAVRAANREPRTLIRAGGGRFEGWNVNTLRVYEDQTHAYIWGGNSGRPWGRSGRSAPGADLDSNLGGILPGRDWGDVLRRDMAGVLGGGDWHIRACGWPRPCCAAVSYDPPLAPGAPLTSPTSSAPAYPQWRWHPDAPPIIFPLRPMWRGLGVDAAVFGAPVFLALLLLGPVRRFVRVRRGLCPRCAYPAGGSPVCSECGGTVKPRAGATA